MKQLNVGFRHSMAKSSSLYYLTAPYEENYFEFVERRLFGKESCSIERTNFAVVNAFKGVFGNYMTQINLVCCNNRYCVSDKKLLLSGDIELNPGPSAIYTTNTNGSEKLTANVVLENRLHELGLRPLDVGGAGDCFFRSISHQLYSDSSHHLDIRATGVQYMRENPERFIESNIENSWGQYLTNMSTPGTWSDHLVIQAVADILNLRIYIIESDENFAAFNVVEAVTPPQQPSVVYIGHVGEYHYMSTLQCNEISHLEQLNKITNLTNVSLCVENLGANYKTVVNENKKRNCKNIKSNARKKKNIKKNSLNENLYIKRKKERIEKNIAKR